MPFPPVPPGFSDHTYANKHGVSLDLRVWPALPSATSSTVSTNGGRAPWVLWSHGGGFVTGSHRTPLPWIFPGFLDQGYHIVSYAYRYSPHASIEDALEDSQDALDWCRAHLPRLVGGDDKIDLDRYVTAGESAGGTMSTLNGHVLVPRPRAVVDVYGVIDFTDEHFVKDGGYVSGKLSGAFTVTELEAAIADGDLSNALSECPEIHPSSGDGQVQAHVEDSLRDWCVSAGLDSFPWTSRHLLQNDIKVYLESNALLIRACTRYNSFPDHAAWLVGARQLSTLGRLDGAIRGTNNIYPPTFFLHGDIDSAVPISQSKAFAARLRELDVDVGEAYEPGMDHVFDAKYTSTDVEGWDVYIAPLLAFVSRHLA